MRLDVKFHQSDQRINVNFDSTINKFSLGFGAVQQVTILGVEKYAGKYDVTPTTDAQTLATRKKYMEDDVRINAIPYYEVSNNSGGNTVYIGTPEVIYPTVEMAVLGKSKLGAMCLGRINK